MTSDAIPSQLNALLPQLGADAVKLLMPYLAQLDAETGRVLVKQGDQWRRCLFFAEWQIFRIRENSNQSLRCGC